MPIYTVLGTREFTYQRKSDGQMIDAVEIHCSLSAYVRPGDTWFGEAVERLFVLRSHLSRIPSVGDHISVVYNRYGAIASITYV